MSAILKVEVAICTLNRSELLRETLQSIAECEPPANVQVRVIVVINSEVAKDDATARVCQSFQERLDLVASYESQQGHTFARNHAVRLAEGDLIIWTDDDVIVDAEWIKSYVDAANEDAAGEIAFWGGKIEPFFVPERPEWIESNWDKLRGCFAERDLGPQAIELTPRKLPYGANFAVRTAIQKEFTFDTELGRRGEAVLGEDELDFFRRLIDAGHQGRWVPASKLKHVIPSSRATQDYVWDYFVGQGRALVTKGEAWTESSFGLMRTALWQMMMWRFKREFAKSDVWTSHLIRGALAEGQRRELKSKR